MDKKYGLYMYFHVDGYFDFIYIVDENKDRVYYSCNKSTQALAKLRELRDLGICGPAPIKRLMRERREVHKLRKHNYKLWKKNLSEGLYFWY